jgi:2C-methyl-D-erythritol 2,4-cyclodiphosphate synthase
MTADKSTLQEESRVAVGGVELPDLPYKMYARSDAEMLMRAYGEACALAERERAAAICDQLEASYGDDGARMAAYQCAAAIRAQTYPTKEQHVG